MKYIGITILVYLSFVSGMYYQWAETEEKIDLSHAVFLARSGLVNIEFHKLKHDEYSDLLSVQKFDELEAEIQKVKAVLKDQEMYFSATCENQPCSEEQINYLSSGQINEP